MDGYTRAGAAPVSGLRPEAGTPGTTIVVFAQTT